MSKLKTHIIVSPLIAAAALLLISCAGLSGCYTITQGTTMLSYLSRAVPLESLLEPEAEHADSAAETQTETELSETEKNRRFVEWVRDIRNFAMQELGLAMSKNYTRYVQIDRDYLAAVVSACASDSFTRHEWHYPVVGAMPYKGFFNVDGARAEREKLEKKGLDVWVRGVDAFSTLGWFRDPLYSYMRDYSAGALADILIHELTHATVFIKGQTQFNEELAEFVGSEGARLYMESRFGVESAEYNSLFAADANNRAYVTFIRELAAELETVYASDKPREEKLREKENIINAAKTRYDAEYESRFTNDNYRGFSELPINNAYIELYRLYYAEDNFFADLYKRAGGNLPAFIAAAKTLEKKDPSGIREPRRRLAKALGVE